MIKKSAYDSIKKSISAIFIHANPDKCKRENDWKSWKYITRKCIQGNVRHLKDDRFSRNWWGFLRTYKIPNNLRILVSSTDHMVKSTIFTGFTLNFILNLSDFFQFYQNYCILDSSPTRKLYFSQKRRTE